jgi:hypothetical protein
MMPTSTRGKAHWRIAPHLQLEPKQDAPLLDRPWVVAAVLLLILGFGLWMRCHRLGEHSFWFDEAAAWRLKEFPLAELLPRVARDNNPPVYHLTLKAWSLIFGDSTVALRSLSVVFGLLTILGVYFLTADIARAWLPERAEQRGVALLAAALLALSVFQTRYAWEARMYPAGAAFLVWSSWALWRALHARPARLGWWLLWTALTLAFAYTHTYAVFSLAAQALFLGGWLATRCWGRWREAWRDASVRHALAAGVLIAVGYAPWIPVLLYQRAQVQQDFTAREPTLAVIIEVCGRMFAKPDYYAVGPLIGAPFFVACFCTGLTLLILAHLCWRPGRAQVFVLCLAGTPFVLSAALSLCDTKIIASRYFVFAHVFLLISLALLIWRVQRPWLRLTAIFVILSASWFGNVFYTDFVDRRGQLGEELASKSILSLAEPDEPIVITKPFHYFPVRYYLRDRHTCFLTEQDVPHWLARAALTPADVLSPEQLAAFPAERIWIVEEAIDDEVIDLAPLGRGWECERSQDFPLYGRVRASIVLSVFRRVEARSDSREQAMTP